MKKFSVERIGLHVTCWTYHSAERIPVSEETVAQGKIEGAEIFSIPPEDATGPGPASPLRDGFSPEGRKEKPEWGEAPASDHERML